MAITTTPTTTQPVLLPNDRTPEPGDPGYTAQGSGLLETATPNQSVIGYQPTMATAERPTSTGYDPTLFNVTKNQTVQGQIGDLIAKDSPLMQQAAARARAAANARGLLNSSIAVGTVHGAVMDRALPIAQQDARTYETANTNSVNAQNAAAAFEAQATNTASAQSADLGTRVGLANADAANQLLNTKLTTGNQMAMAQLDATTRSAIAELDNRYRVTLQMSQNAQQTVNQAMSNIANIAASNTMSAAAKDAATKSQLNMLNEALQAQEALRDPKVQSLNLGRFFSTSSSNQNVSQPYDQKAYDAAMAKYRQQVEAREKSWAAWDAGGRSGPWNVPVPVKPKMENYYR